MKKYLIIYINVLLIQFGSIAQVSVVKSNVYGGSLKDELQSFVLDTNGEKILFGTTFSMDGDVDTNIGISDYWILKLNDSNIIVDQHNYGGTFDETAVRIIKSFDNKIMLCGTSGSYDYNVSGSHGDEDIWTVKLYQFDTIEWEKCNGGSDIDFANGVIQTSDSGYLLIGNTFSINGDVPHAHGQEDYLVIKLDSNGNTQWSNSFGGVDMDVPISATQQNDGYLIVGGTVSSDGDVNCFHGNNSGDIWLIKIDLSGNLLWQRCYGGTSVDFPNKIMLTENGGFYISGTTYSTDGDVTGIHGVNDFWLVKCDSSGNILWANCYGGNSHETCNNAAITSDKGVVMVGTSELDDGIVSGNHGGYDFFVVKVDSLGNYEWSKCLGGTGDDIPYDVRENSRGEIIIGGSTTSSDGDVPFNHGQEDFWLVTIAPPGLGINSFDYTLKEVAIIDASNSIAVRFFSRLHEKAALSIYNIAGQKIVTQPIEITEGINYFSVPFNFTRGSYCVRIEGDGVSGSKMFVR